MTFMALLTVHCNVLATDAAICGNQVVEGDEECDCGFDDDCTDRCCYSADKGDDKCTLKSFANCR